MFLIQIMACIGIYFFGANGIKAVFIMKKNNTIIEHEVQVARENVQNMEQEIDLWEEDPFYVERHAREKLAMAREGDEIYLLE